MTPRREARGGLRMNGEARRWLEAASRWRLLSLFFQLPTPGSRRELRRLAGSVPKDLAGLAAEWVGVPLRLAAAEYHRVLGPGGIPAMESSYDPNALAGRGPLLADIAGFHEAFAYRPEKPAAEVPDHIAVELDFLSYLSVKAAFAFHEGHAEKAQIAEQASERFVEHHLATWIVAFREKLERSGSAFFVRAAGSIEIPESKYRKSSGALRILVAVLLILSHVAPARARPAQEKPPAMVAAAARAPNTLKLGGVTFTGSLRGRLENWGWFEAPAGDDHYTFGAFNLRLALGQRKKRFEWKVESLFPLLIALPTNAILPAPQGQLGLGASYFAANGRQDGSAILRQGYVSFKKLFRDSASSLRLGRFEFADGAEVTPADATLAALKRDRIAHRLIGNFGFSHVGRGFDGVEYMRDTELNNITVVAARPTEGVFQLRSLKELDVDFYYAVYTRQFNGKKARSEARTFVLHYHDGRRALKTDNRHQAVRAADLRNIRLTTIGGHYLGVFGSGSAKTDLLLWGAGQFGRWGELDHLAAAIAIEAGHQFSARWRPWLRGGHFGSTGDGDSTDQVHTTFFQVLPTPRIYARFPFYNLMNNEDWFAELLLKPAPKLMLRTGVHYLRLSSRGDLWYQGGGAFQKQTFGYVGRPSNQHRALGTLFDLGLDYDFTSMTRLSFYVAGVRGGDVASATYSDGGRHPTAHFLYLEFLQRF